jgi:lysophospholipase L1-like esterase
MKPRMIITLVGLGYLAACSPASEPTIEAPNAPVGSVDRGADLPSPGRYTLVLGDSHAFGWQPFKDNSDARNFSTGFGTLFVARLNKSRPDLHAKEVNLACPGETSTTAVEGGCFYVGLGLPLHVPYEGAQLQAADGFLRTHRRQVNPVIIALGLNDVAFLYFNDCNFDQKCTKARLPGVLKTLSRNLDRLLGDVRTLAPDAEVLVALEAGLPDPFATRLVDALAKRVTRIGKRYDAVLVDLRSVITVENACVTTFLCTELNDGHPSDVGYRRMSRRFWEASRFGS